MYRFILSLLMLLLSLPASAARVIELIPLQSQLPESIIPVIQPLLSEGDAISGMNNQLILKVDESQLPRIRELVRQLDRPPQRLLIEVSHAGHLRDNDAGYDVRGRISTSGDSQVNVQVIQRRTRDQFDASQMIHATEGYPALIRYGQVIPYQAYDVEVDGGRIRRERYTEFLDATSGVYVIPRLNGDRVSLEITQQRNRPHATRGSLAVQRASTFVGGQLGEWIRLGGIGESTYQQGQGIVSRRTSDLNQDQQIYVRVTIAR